MFKKKKLPLLDIDELRLPAGVRSLDAPWAGKPYDMLSTELQSQFDNTSIDVYIIDSVSHDDEVRDLFIRLQSGTPLSFQQVLDAWPGPMCQYVKASAGSLDLPHPRFKLFGLVDNRGESLDPTGKDRFVADRTRCAQLLTILLKRKFSPIHFPSVSASQLRDLYHETTDFDASDTHVREMEASIFWAQKAMNAFLAAKGTHGRRRNKVPKLAAFSAVLFHFDASRITTFKLDDDAPRS
ncbi:MAG: hypothetical protein KY476_06570 [Planctomycetes bacterium]|nr:hypothetical protein [Planctomycetota bacterium]